MKIWSKDKFDLFDLIFSVYCFVLFVSVYYSILTNKNEFTVPFTSKPLVHLINNENNYLIYLIIAISILFAGGRMLTKYAKKLK